MSPPIAIIVDPYSSGNLLAPAFREAGIAPVAVLSGASPPAVYASTYRPDDFDLVITHDGSLARTIDRVRALRPLCVVPGGEHGVELADQVAAAVTPHLANVPHLAAARRHKGAMHAAVAASGLATIPQVCTADEAEAAAWIDREHLSGRDLVLKPPKSSGTDGVTRVRAGEDWRSVFRGLLGRRNRHDLVNDQVVVQEHVAGTEYVVDTFTHGGVHTLTDICRYRKITDERGIPLYDSVEWMPCDRVVYRELIAYAMAVLFAVGIRFGAAHSEIMMTPAGPRLIETSARLHGAGQPRFCRVATGDSQADRIVRYCAGDRGIAAGFTLQRKVLVVLLYARVAGVVRNADIYDEVRDLASYHPLSTIGVRNGDPIEATSDLFTNIGFVVLAHERADQVAADYRAIRELERRLVIEPADAGIPGIGG
jgi:biotin carboxylase